MAGLPRRIADLLSNQVFRRVRGRPSPAVYWDLPEPPAVTDSAAFDRYRAASPPPYLMDYRAKLAYREMGSRGVIVLHYPGDTGTQVNPEAAFQYALGLLDGGDRDAFLAAAEWFLADQTADGRWLYRFTWHRSANPWASALAQSRGVSVMIRAAILRNDDRYYDAARRAADVLEQPVSAGGFRATHPAAGVSYFEEYPAEPTAVLNGYIATLFGLFELGHWTGNDAARATFESGLDSLEAMLPHYEYRGWSLYDLDPRSPMPNYNSPRYHQLVTDYLAVLAAITGRESLAKARDRWRASNRAATRARAVVMKVARKLAYK